MSKPPAAGFNYNHTLRGFVQNLWAVVKSTLMQITAGILSINSL
ncbi:hypothetical protein [Ilyomonas limi]|nr:hypothetical protein [Ilyomonas limi]